MATPRKKKDAELKPDAPKSKASQQSDQKTPRSSHGYSPEAIASIAKDFVEKYGPEEACDKAIDLLEAAASANAARRALYEMENPGKMVPFKEAIKKITGCTDYEHARERYEDFVIMNLGLLIADQKGFEYLGVTPAETPASSSEVLEWDYEPVLKEVIAKQRKKGLGSLQVDVLSGVFKVWAKKTSKRGGKTSVQRKM